MTNRVVRIGALAALVATVACGDSTGGRPVPASLRFAEAEPVVEVGARKRLDVAVLDDQGRPIADAAVRFTSGRPDLVEVDSLTGVMTGKARGVAEITVVAEPVRATVAVAVQPTGGLVVAKLALVSPTYPVLGFRDWPRHPVQVPMVMENGAGVSVCGLVPLAAEVTDTTVMLLTHALGPEAPCALTVQPRREGSTWLRVRSGERADSLHLRVTYTRFQGTYRAIGSREVGSIMRWEVEIHSEDGIPLSGLPVTFHYSEKYYWPEPTEPSVDVHTDARGVARFQRRLPVTTWYTSSGMNGSMGSWRTNAYVGWMDITAWLDAYSGFFRPSDHRGLSPGPPVSVDAMVLNCGPTRCSIDRAAVPISLARCAEPGHAAQFLVAFTRDSFGNAGTRAPAVTAAPGVLESTHEGEYLERAVFTEGFTESGYSGSRVTYALLAPTVDTATVTITAQGLPPRAVPVVRNTAGCRS